GDVFNPNSPFNFGNTRARHSVESKPEDFTAYHKLLSIAWGEYMSFTQSGESIGYALTSTYTSATKRKQGWLLCRMPLTSAQPCLSTAQDKGSKASNIRGNCKTLHSCRIIAI
ncbi:MAG: hypothetical protein Q9N62_14720, partial [Ghiorsea sp.]|nr:hypothetical protein [Ghiorsea sp.]